MTAGAWTILIVDDELTNRKLLETLLQAEGYETITAASGPAGLAMVGEHRPDLILLDVMMPGMDGYEVATALKSKTSTAHIPIIMVSAQDDRDARLAGLTAGAEEYITKPIDRAELYLRARNLLRLKDLSDNLNAQSEALEAQVQSRTAELELLAHFDSLTGLPNRTLFHDRLTTLLESTNTAGSDRVLGVLFIDVDHFKNVNDSLGHRMGDKLLREVGKRIANCVRGRDTVGRIGGDEFALIVSLHDGPRDAAAVAEKVGEAMRRPFVINGNEVLVGASIGISLYPADATDPENLVQYADTAMNRAKDSGRDCYRFFTPQMGEDLRARLALESAVRRAVERDELVLHYQPKVDLSTGRICGVEALLRWHRPGHGVISPAEFIPVLESTGLIVPVGRWVLDEAAAQIGRWLSSGIGRLPIAVNVSGLQFIGDDIAEEVADVLAAYGIPPDLLELELTESTLMEHTERTSASLTKLRARGVKISIDDFGTGYSSLAYLRRFPIDTLKIDRAFVQEITTNVDDAAIALTIIRLAHGLNLNVVAEGIETAAQVTFLRDHGCDQMQGFYFSRPLPVAELERLLADGACLYTDGLDAAAADRVHPRVVGLDVSGDRDVLADPAVIEVLESLQWSGSSMQTMASALNRAGTQAPSGVRWTPKSVMHQLAKFSARDTSVPPAPARNQLLRHDVHVYDDDEDLADRVSTYLAKALHEGAACVVIATKAHRDQFRQALVDLGLADSLHSPRFVEHDANDLLDTFMREGLPVAELFDRSVTPFLGVGGDDTAVVHSYGEMVDILWRAGNVAGAAQLEDLWNDLQRRHGFQLLCAYAAEGLVKSSHDDVGAMRIRHGVTTSTVAG